MTRRAICASLVRSSLKFSGSCSACCKNSSISFMKIGARTMTLGLVLDAVGIEIVFGARHAPAAPIALGGHHHGMGAGMGVMLALLCALPAVVTAQDPPRSAGDRG